MKFRVGLDAGLTLVASNMPTKNSKAPRFLHLGVMDLTSIFPAAKCTLHQRKKQQLPKIKSWNSLLEKRKQKRLSGSFWQENYLSPSTVGHFHLLIKSSPEWSKIVRNLLQKSQTTVHPYCTVFKCFYSNMEKHYISLSNPNQNKIKIKNIKIKLSLKAFFRKYTQKHVSSTFACFPMFLAIKKKNRKQSGSFSYACNLYHKSQIKTCFTHIWLFSNVSIEKSCSGSFSQEKNGSTSKAENFIFLSNPTQNQNKCWFSNVFFFFF